MSDETQGAIDPIDRMWKLAERISPARFIPEHFRGDNPTVFYLLATSEDLGLKWTHGLRSMYMDKEGSLGMRGEVILALLLQHGFKVKFIPSTEPVIGCSCEITRPDGGESVSRSFTMTDAERIKTHWNGERWVSLAENSFYKNYPSDMTQWRSLARCARVAGADLAGGIFYLPEELREVSRQQKSEAATSPDVPPPSEQATPADPFVVGEKPVPPAEPEPKPDNVVEMKPPAPPVEETPTPEAKAEPKPEPPAKEEWRIASEIDVTKGPVWTEGEASQNSKESAMLRGAALANQYGHTLWVFRLVSGQIKDMPYSCYAPEKPQSAPRPAPPPEPTPATVPAPAPIPVSGTPEEQFTQLVGIMRGRIGGVTKDADKLIGRYFCAYLHTDKVPKGDRIRLVPLLKKLVDAGEGIIGDLKADPEALGVALSGRVQSKLNEEFDILQWAQPIRDLAQKVRAMNNQDEKEFLTWINTPMAGALAIAQLEPAVVYPLFQLYLLVRERAFEPIDTALAMNRSVAQTMKELIECSGVPLADWDLGFATAVLDTLKTVAKPEPEDPLAGGLPFGPLN